MDVIVGAQGMAEIQLIWERLSVSRRFSGLASQWLLPLHSSVAPADQRRVFQSPPKGIRKVGIFVFQHYKHTINKTVVLVIISSSKSIK